MIIDDKETAVKSYFNKFINFARAIYESQYGDGIGIDGEATVSAEIDEARKIHISITMKDLKDGETNE